MKSSHLHILQHSLGVDQYGRGPQYRNHFVTGGRCEDFLLCKELVEMGLMVEQGVAVIPEADHCFIVTYDGKKAMADGSPPAPKLSRSALRYREFLSEDSGMSFGEWLRAQKHWKRYLKDREAMA